MSDATSATAWITGAAGETVTVRIWFYHCTTEILFAKIVSYSRLQCSLPHLPLPTPGHYQYNHAYARSTAAFVGRLLAENDHHHRCNCTFNLTMSPGGMVRTGDDGRGWGAAAHLHRWIIRRGFHDGEW